MPRPLGPTQACVLAAMIRHGGYWYPGCGWMWDTVSGTTRHMQALARRGLVAARQEPGHSYTRWDVTDAGREIR